MGSQRFDRYVQALSRELPRRSALAVLAGFAGFVVTGFGEVAGHHKNTHKKGRCSAASTCSPKVNQVFCTGPQGELCGQVQNVDGGCACIEPVCGEACTTGSGCASGLCVSVPGCCSAAGDSFCGTPCGTR
jgi:hypothetical protein